MGTWIVDNPLAIQLFYENGFVFSFVPQTYLPLGRVKIIVLDFIEFLRRYIICYTIGQLSQFTMITVKTERKYTSQYKNNNNHGQYNILNNGCRGVPVRRIIYIDDWCASCLYCSAAKRTLLVIIGKSGTSFTGPQVIWGSQI